MPGVAGTWKDLTDNVNSMAGNLTGAGPQHRRRDDRRRRRRLVAQDYRRRERRNSAAEGNHQHDGRPAERVRVRSDARRPRGRHRRQASAVRPTSAALPAPGKISPTSVNSMASNLTAQVRNIAEVTTAIAQWRLVEEDHRRRPRRNPRAEGHHQHDGRSAERLRRRGEARRARSRHRRQARRTGRRARRGRHLERSDRQRQLDGEQPHGSGPQHRRSGDRRGAAATCRRRSPSTSGAKSCSSKNTINTMVDQLNAFASEVTRVAREVGTEGKLGGQAAGARRRRHLEGPDRQRQLDGRAT